MDRFRAAIDELVDKVKEAINGEPKSPVEILLDQYLSIDEADAVSFSPKNCTAVAIPTAVLNDFAARTKNVVDYPSIMERVWEILIDHQHDPALMKKALNLLLFLLVNGAIQVLKDCQEAVRMTFLINLAEDYNRYEFEQYQFSQHLDVGASVRKTAAEIHHLLTNERELFHARRKAEVLHQKLSDRGLRSASSTALMLSSPTSDVRPPQYTDRYSAGEDVALKIVTHPDDMFDEPPRSLRATVSSPSSLTHQPQSTEEENGRPTEDGPLQSSRARNLKERSYIRDAEDSQRQPPGKKQTESRHIEESVDLLGLQALGLESLVASPRLQKPEPRSQSARNAPSPQFSATI